MEDKGECEDGGREGWRNRARAHARLVGGLSKHLISVLCANRIPPDKGLLFSWPPARARLVGGAAGEEVVEYVEEGGVLELGEEDRLERRRRDQVAPNI